MPTSKRLTKQEQITMLEAMVKLEREAHRQTQKQLAAAEAALETHRDYMVLAREYFKTK